MSWSFSAGGTPADVKGQLQEQAATTKSQAHPDRCLKLIDAQLATVDAALEGLPEDRTVSASCYGHATEDGVGTSVGMSLSIGAVVTAEPSPA